MGRKLIVDNYIIDKPIIEILKDLQSSLNNGKLKDIRQMNDYIMVTCVNRNHKNGLEKNPDCGIYVGDDLEKEFGFAHCFACSWKSNFVSFVAEAFECNKDIAKKWLISNYGKLIKESIILGEPIVLKTDYSKRSEKDASNLSKYQSYCPYLQKRKVSREIANLFQVKYDPIKRQIIFPCFDETGKLITITKRNIDYKRFELEKNAEKPVYGLDIVIKQQIKSVILTEGQFDVLTAWSYGFPAISTFGGMSNEQINKINKSCISNIYLMMDNDEAGKKFAASLKKKLDKRLLVTCVNIPNGFKDINDLDKETFWKILIDAKNKNDFIV